MSLALEEAWKYQGLTYPNPPVGALILDQNNQILAIEAHHKAGTAHAELLAIESALIKMGDTTLAHLQTPNEKHAYILSHHDNRLKGCSIYVTLEPCNHQGSTPACSSLIKNLGFQTLICGHKDPNQKATGGIKVLQDSGADVIMGIEEEACQILLYPFTKWQKNEPFVFFKLALSANGVYDGGIITSHASRSKVHQMRDCIDLLIIGGETVRIDRPTLDSRLVGGKAPDVLIFSHRDDFDTTIPLFQVPNRKVLIQNHLNNIDHYRFIMIEGAQRMMQTTDFLVDWYCIFRSSSYKKGSTIQLEKKMKHLHTITDGDDTQTWYKGEKR